MYLDPIRLTQELVNIKSVSRWSNTEIAHLLEERLKQCAFEVERLEYIDDNGECKVSLVAKKGEGVDGLAFFSHTDTVPGLEEDWDAFSAVIQEERIIGRGSCDMKGPLAATVVAAAAVDAARLKKPVFVMATADEEVSGRGAQQVAKESILFNSARPRQGVIAEPTRLTPVYAHKGGAQIRVTARGRAAHTSTDLGVSANFIIAPFLAEMTELAERLKTDKSFMNHEFRPPTNGFNMIIDDGGCKQNMTAPKTVCSLYFRTMPKDRSEDLMAMITAKAEQFGFEVSSKLVEPFYISPEREIVQIASQVTGGKQPGTVCYGTDAFSLRGHLDLVVLGPGDIAQAHTVGEWIDVAQLNEAVVVYKRMIETLCM